MKTRNCSGQSAVGGDVGYGMMDYQQQLQQQYYYQLQQQQQQQQHQQALLTRQQQYQNQQKIAGVMGYYPPEAAAMFYNTYAYQQMMGSLFPYHTQRTPQLTDYQLTPALYLLNQQAEMLQRSLASRSGDQQQQKAKPKAESKKPATTTTRKTRGPYKLRANKSVEDQPKVNTDRASLLDVSETSNNNRSTSSITDTTQHLSLSASTPSRKRKSDSFLEYEDQRKEQRQEPPKKQTTFGMIRQRRQSIFYSVELMAESSCATQR